MYVTVGWLIDFVFYVPFNSYGHMEVVIQFLVSSKKKKKMEKSMTCIHKTFFMLNSTEHEI